MSAPSKPMSNGVLMLVAAIVLIAVGAVSWMQHLQGGQGGPRDAGGMLAGLAAIAFAVMALAKRGSPQRRRDPVRFWTIFVLLAGTGTILVLSGLSRFALI
ncbi:hypothetical protein P1X14_06720 [Sphingomonas sp. AOB5]|uniref:hypothetical protein n=1 Tax=Sphingomonas sp. AOB5 TaxID=3034017 RepID=UPI0023F7C6ED|nr:hypothetical protein [Sphingomonas sp. AOB5]MDF7774931.1 hypothetical protein [Sphingomonas sp. AOB5]